jgi:hypothetical protein
VQTVRIDLSGFVAFWVGFFGVLAVQQLFANQSAKAETSSR